MDSPQGAVPQHNNEASYQDGVAAALMATEELRQSLMQDEEITSPMCLQIRHRMEELMPILFSLHPRDEVEADLRHHCHSRAGAVALEALQYVTSKSDDPEHDNPDVERDVQGAVARMAELTFALHEREDQESIRQDVIATYAAYQRKVIRQRVTPSMTKLVARRQWKMKHAESWANQAEEEEDDDEDGSHQKATHSNVITTILGQASALIHPLIVWKSHLPPPEESATPIRQLCTDAIAILDQQAQTLTQTVSGWCLEDKRVDTFWMGQSAGEVPCDSSELGELDGLVDELAFACQIFDRYLSLLAPEQNKETASIIRDLHAEWNWKYASLERYLTTQQLQSALRLAHPVQIVLGTPIQVPSVVEDAQYLSTRALERAASARSTQAIGTVAHAIASNVWSTEPTAVGGVHQALVEQKGCYKEQATESASAAALSPKSSKPSSNSFALALMGALDEDLASSTPTKSPAPSNRPPSAPSSGAFLGIGSLSTSLAGGGEKFQLIRIETCLCALNGIHSASSACASLVKFLDSLLPEERGATGTDQASDMIQLAREELFRYSKQYTLLLKTQGAVVVTEFCGSLAESPVYRGNHCIPVLRYYLERENYDIPTVEALQTAEDDARLYQQLIQPLQESLFLQQLTKCDSDVLVEICGELASRLVDLFLDCLTSQVIPKQFTDWGSLLLSKQVRTVQNYISKLMEKLSDGAIPMLPQWERLSQALTVLQLEKPSDWSFYQASSTLTAEELQRILSLRKGFSSDAIAAVVASVKANEAT